MSERMRVEELQQVTPAEGKVGSGTLEQVVE